MNPIVPFVQNLYEKDASAWHKALQASMPNVKICKISDLSEDELNSVNVAIVANPNPADLSCLPNLKWIQSLWAGVERLLDEIKNEEISIVRLIDPQLSKTMAEAVLAWTFYLHRNMPEYAKQQNNKEWLQHDFVPASKRTVGILGLGHLGAEAARRLLDNGFKVIGWNSGKKQPDIECFSGDEGLLKIAALSDIVVVLLPSTPQTKGLLSKQFFAHLKHGASLINFARANIIDTNALVKGLETRQINHAVLDVFLNEPLEKTDPLWDNPNITILPHISAPSNRDTASQIVAKNLNAYFNSNKIPEAVSRKIGY